MPLFEYHCRDCGQNFEVLLRASQTASCPHCHGQALEKLVSAPTPPGRSKDLIRAARRRAAKEGHLSNFSASEKAKLLR
mgnify:CR=1 FL=1|jgi:putative FmdB family regulatory protein